MGRLGVFLSGPFCFLSAFSSSPLFAFPFHIRFSTTLIRPSLITMRGTFVAALALAATVIAAPNRMRKVNALNKRATTVTDIDPVVLNYALTLEHLEAAFYAQALSQFSADDFANAGYPDWVRYRLTEIAAHEAQHVALLSGALTAAGANATEACTYEFGLTSPASVLATAQVLEGVGVSAYTGKPPIESGTRGPLT